MKSGNKLKEKSKQQKVPILNLVQDDENIVWELHDTAAVSDDDALDHPNIRYNCSYPRPLEEYYEGLICAYREKRYKFVYKYLRRSPLIVFISEKLASYFNDELASYFKEEPAPEETEKELALKGTKKELALKETHKNLALKETYKKHALKETHKKLDLKETHKKLGLKETHKKLYLKETHKETHKKLYLKETHKELDLKETHKELDLKETHKKPEVSKNIIKVLHSIHCLNSNKRSLPSVYRNILVGYDIDSYLPQLCSPNFQINNSCFCFLILKIAADIMSNIFAKHPTKESENTCQNVLGAICCEAFHDICIQLPFVHFYAIAVYLSVGIEMLSATFYPSLEAYFRHLFGDPSGKENTPGTVSQNVLSSHCVLKVWDEITFFYESWVKYCFIYPHIIKNKLKFKTLVKPDLSILEDSFIRFRMRYEIVHFEEGYVPCEYPIIPNSPRYLKNFPSSNESYHFFSFKEMYFNLGNIVDEIIGPGYCEKCKKNKCSCVKNCIKLKPLKKRLLLLPMVHDVRRKYRSIGVYNYFYFLEKYNISYRIKKTGSSSKAKGFRVTSRKRKRT